MARAHAENRGRFTSIDVEDQKIVVPLWRTISIIGSIVLSAAYLSWHVSTSITAINSRFESLDKSIGQLVQSIDRLTSDKVSKKDLQLFCVTAQLRNRNWVCPAPFDDSPTTPLNQHFIQGQPRVTQ